MNEIEKKALEELESWEIRTFEGNINMDHADEYFGSNDRGGTYVSLPGGINVIPSPYKGPCRENLFVLIGSKDDQIQRMAKALESLKICGHKIIVFHAVTWDMSIWQVMKPSFEHLAQKIGDVTIYLKLMGINYLAKLLE
ncbi:MAG: hypothetical protein ACXQS8_09615 [Candidatus Helarchaeales archaeon]